jgi:hypothetical protein
MNKALRKVCAAPLLLVALMAACSSPPEPANNNTAASSPVAQNGTVPASSDTSTPAAAPSGQPAVAPVEGAKVETAPATIAAAGQLVTGPTPKLVVPAAKIDFGKQPQSKSIARTITIRNAGKAALNIAAVEPS